MANTHSPTLSWLESPHGTTGTAVTPILSSAMSVAGSVRVRDGRGPRPGGQNQSRHEGRHDKCDGEREPSNHGVTEIADCRLLQIADLLQIRARFSIFNLQSSIYFI